MNRPPEEIVARPRAEDLRNFVMRVFVELGMTDDDARLIAELIVGNDLRGVVSHSSQRIGNYVRQFQNGELNPRPSLSVRAETPSTFVVDGDGGLGYFAAHRAAHMLVEKARRSGIAAALTRNHGHIGAAGIYSRIVVAHDLICYGTSGHQLSLKEDHRILRAGGGSPMTFAVPAGEEHPLVLDFGALHDLYDGSPHVDELFRLAPGLVFRQLGLGVMCQALGGLLAGVPVDPERAERAYSGANQGSLFIAIDPERFLPLDRYKAEIDEYVQRARQMRPMPGFEPALPGGPEWQRERRYAEEGVPFGREGVERLRQVAETLGLEPPF